MLSKRILFIGLTLVAVAAGLILCSCGGRQEMSGNVIVQNNTFTLTGDSLVEDTVFARVVSPDRIETNLTMARLDSLYRWVDTSKVRFVHGRPWRMRQPRPAVMPEYISNQPLIDALYNMSMDHITDAIEASGRFAVSQRNYSRLYCSIFLSLAALKPHQSMETLRALVDRDSIIMQREGQWPVVSDHIGWATAAWEVYKMTGDRQWLKFSYRVIEKTLTINNAVLQDHQTGLVHGAGYTSAKPLGIRRMTWMGYNDLFACMSLGNNILTAHANWVLAAMGEELGINNDEYPREAQRLKDAINQHLWNEDKGFYCSFLYGMAVPRQAPLTDNTSQAMCVLWNIADDHRAENLISYTPVSDYGVNITYPPGNPIEPYFANSSWATTQAMWNMAAAMVGNENALRRGLGALYRAQALYQSRGIHLESVETDLLGTSASNAAMILRVLIGMSFTPEGIEFSPMVPAGMDGKKTLKGLNYRRAVLDFTVEGTGSDIVSITLDGKPLESPFLPCDIEGRHQVAITLKPASHRPSQHVSIHKGDIYLPMTPQIIWNGDTGHIVDYVAGTPYRLSSNGELTELNDSVFVLPKTEGLTEFSVEIAGKNVNGFMSRPLLRFGLTPQMAPFPKTDGDSTTIKVTVARGGDYLIDVGYRPTGTLDIRRVTINGHPMGTLVMASGAGTEENETAYSNIINVKLLKGENTIRFDQVRLPKAFTPCVPVHVRVISR